MPRIVEWFYGFKIWLFKKMSDNVPEGNYVINTPVLFLGKGKISLGNGVVLGCKDNPYCYSSHSYIKAKNVSASVIIKDGTVINNNMVIGCEDGTVSIGKKCFIGPNFYLMNNDGHNLDPAKRNLSGIVKDVKIGDNVFIGTNVTILKGVKIGKNCVIGAGAVVTKSFPDNCIIAGNPAKLIRKI